MKIKTLLLSLLLAQQALAQDCDSIAMNKSAPPTRYQDHYGIFGPQKPASWNTTKMKAHLAKVDSWLRNVLTGFAGAKVQYGYNYELDNVTGGGPEFFKATGVKASYYLRTQFFAHYCRNNKVLTEIESGSRVIVTINNAFVSLFTEGTGIYTEDGKYANLVNGKYSFLVLEKAYTDGRVDYYDVRKRMDISDTIFTSKGEFIVIRNTDKPLFIRITRKEYLEQLLKNVELSRTKYKEKMVWIYNNGAKQFEAEMKSFKLDRNYTPEKEAKRRKWFEEDQAKTEKLIKKIDADVDGSLEVIKQYQRKPAEWLNRTLRGYYHDLHFTPDRLTRYLEDLDNFKESSRDYTRFEMVYINPEYFNKALPPDVPQVVVVTIDKNGYRYMYPLSDKIKATASIVSLVALANPAPKETISTASGR